MTWHATVLTIFPEMLPGPLAYSLAGKALKAGLWRLETVDIRDFARDKHRSVDDAPFGGGPGMVMRPDVLDAAIAGAGGVGAADAAVAARPPARSAAGARARRDAGCDADLRPLRGGRRACAGGARHRGGKPRRFCAVGRRAGGDRADRCLRAACCPGVVGCAETLAEESFAEGLLEYPQYTRPQLWQGRAVPEVLVSGDHRTDPGVAPGRGGAPDPRAPARFVGAPSGGAGVSRRARDRDREVDR